MKFSVIIPTCNRNEQLAQCLDKLAPGQQTLPSDQYEVIVSDDGQEYAAEVFCRQHYPWASYTRGPRKGPAANRNCGAKIAAGDWLVFTDDDCLPDAGWLHAYANAIHQYPECNAFEGAILPDDWNLLKKDMAECPVNTEGGCFWSANIMVQRDLFKKVGCFDEQYRIAAQEDQDIELRISKYTVIIFLMNAIIVHPVRLVSLKRKIENIPIMFENWLLFIKKNFPDKTRFHFYRRLRIHLKLFLKSFSKGHFKASTFHFYCIAGLFNYTKNI